MYPVGSAPCSPQSPLLWSFAPFFFFSKRFYDQLTSGFRIPHQCRFWIPTHWILDSNFKTSWIPDSRFCYMGRVSPNMIVLPFKHCHDSSQYSPSSSLFRLAMTLPVSLSSSQTRRFRASLCSSNHIS